MWNWLSYKSTNNNNNENDDDEWKAGSRKSFSIIINFPLNYAQGNSMEASNGSCNTYNAYTKQHKKTQSI